MKLSVNWLRTFVADLSGGIQSLVDRLTALGFEVEGIDELTLPDPRIVVGRIEAVDKHPNAERLSLCRVDVGGAEVLPIVCGAPNVKPGMLVPVATEKARLTSADGQTLTIKPSKIRGERSLGMICAADELGLSDDHSGVMELDAGCVVGEPLARYLEADQVLDIAVTPNRPDVLSHLGIARELAVGSPLMPLKRASLSFEPAASLVSCLDHELVPYYTAVVIRGVRVGESPEWLRQRLERIGLRPRNNIVDCTNYILHALGQPLHAFDLAKLAGGRVVVRSDRECSFTALNNATCAVRPGMAVICDAEGTVAALGGIMGGLDSSVSSATTDILLESALFQTTAVRRTSKKLGLSTDSSYRFERGVDPCGVLRASECAVALILELAGGTVAIAEEAGNRPAGGSKLCFRPERINGLLGTAIPAEQMVSMLERIGFEECARDDQGITVSVPSFRIDVREEIDLVEEIARLHGYAHIEPSPQMATIYPQQRSFPEYFPDFLRSLMVGLGFRELLTNPLMRRDEAEPFGLHLVEVLNPISEGLEVLRPSLLPGLLKVVAHNIRHGNRDLRFFEVARGFRRLVAGEATGEECAPDGYGEVEQLVIAMTGSRTPRLWNQPAGIVDFFDLSGAVEMLLEKLNLLDKSSVNLYNDATVGSNLELLLRDPDGGSEMIRFGLIQQVNEKILKKFDIEQELFVAELDVRLLERCFSPVVSYVPPFRFPVVQRDLSFMLPAGVHVQALVALVKSCDQLIRAVTVFDLFERPGHESEGRSVALSLEIADKNATLEDARVADILMKIGRIAERELGAVIRQV